MMHTHRLTSTALSIALVALCALGLSLAGAAAAHATSYSLKGAFDENHGQYPLGVAVDQTNNNVYVADNSEGVFQFEAAGTPVPPEPFSTGYSSYYYTSGVAVDPENENVYAYEAFPSPEIYTLTQSGTEIRHFAVTGGHKFVQIASDAAGDVFYPNETEKTVQEFEPTAEGESPTPKMTIAGTGAHELVQPKGVAVDSERGKVYVVDAGNGGATPGRVQVFNASSGAYESTLDEGGSQDVAVDPVSGDVFVVDLGASGYHVVAYHTGESTPFADFGLGTIGTGEFPDRIAVDHGTGDVYVSVSGESQHKVWIFAPGTPLEVTYPPLPSERVTGVTDSEATLHGEVNPQGKETTCYFEYGTSEAYGHIMPCQPETVGSGSKPKPVSTSISGLEGNTEYHYRLLAKTASGEVAAGADETFTTLQAPPAVSGLFASGVSQGDVTFNAMVNPQHLDTTWYVNYATLPLGSSCAPVVPFASVPATPLDMGAGSALEAVSLELAGSSVLLGSGLASGALAPNTVYHYQLVAHNEAGTECAPEGIFTTLPPDPTASTGGASQVTQGTATISGSVTPGSSGPNSDTTWSFQYGTDTSYGSGSVPASPGDAGMGTSAVVVETALTGLEPNTTYHYRLLASNANQDPEANPAAAPQLVYGADRTFTTPPVEPLLGQPSGLGETAVTLNGEVNPAGHDLRYSFQYGPSSQYGQSTPVQDAGEGAALTEVSAALADLAPGTYHYRLVAIGAEGVESYTPDSTFTLYAPPPAPGANPFSPGQSIPVPFPTPALLNIPTPPPPPLETTTTTPKALTNAQKLAKALKACARKPRQKRATCEKQARRTYGPAAGRKKRKKT
jgi:DNA-binding beta-propeller fold protein YncE